MRSKDRALHAPARLHSYAEKWRRAASDLESIGSEVGQAFASAHGRPRGPITTLRGPDSIGAAGDPHET